MAALAAGADPDAALRERLQSKETVVMSFDRSIARCAAKFSRLTQVLADPASDQAAQEVRV